MICELIKIMDHRKLQTSVEYPDWHCFDTVTDVYTMLIFSNVSSKIDALTQIRFRPEQINDFVKPLLLTLQNKNEKIK